MAPVSADGKPIKGHPVQIVSATEDHNFVLNEEALHGILLDPRVRNRDVVIVSLAGAFRKGKSFLLDFGLRYLFAECSDDWLGDPNSPLEGFSWRGGSERDTTGILLWSEPFIMKKDKSEVALLVMDTQGAFDCESTVKDCATIFALSTMLSSVQVFNLSMNIQEDDLHHLQLFTEYGKLAIEGNDHCKPFQTLLFLVRDWCYPYEAEFGLEGGSKILKRRLKVSFKQHSELQQLRKHIHSYFKKIECYLMPHPGLKVAMSAQFDGRLSEIEEDFVDQLEDLIPHLFDAENLEIKMINGRNVTGKELFEYFKSYVQIFNGNDLPEPKTILQATSEANNLAAIAIGRESYIKEMDGVCGGFRPYILPERLRREHELAKGRAMNLFRSTKKMGGEEFSKTYEKKLEDELDAQFERFSNQNEAKSLFVTFRTPFILILIMILSFTTSSVFRFFGFNVPANFFNLIGGIALILLVIWIYVRIVGDFSDVGLYIDRLADAIWIVTIHPIYSKVVTGKTESAALDSLQPQLVETRKIK